MKQLLSLALLCGACVATAQAQSVIIVDKDGMQHKFCTDYVKDITFVDADAPLPPQSIDFNVVTVDPYTANAELTFLTGDGTALTLDVYTDGVNYIKNGTYTVSDQNGANVILVGTVSQFKQGETSVAVTAGTMKVDGTEADYDIVLNLELADGRKIEGKYSGVLSAYSRFVEATATAMVQKDINDAIPGEFYFMLNDANYGFELRMDFFTDGTSDVLPAGVYTFSDAKTPGTFGPKSVIDLYNPNLNSPVTGSAIVSHIDNRTVVSMELEISDGRTYLITFDGTPTYLNAPEVNVVNVDFNRTYVNPYGGGNIGLTLYGENGDELGLDVYTSGVNYLENGTYRVSYVQEENVIVADDGEYTYCTVNGEKHTLKSGNVTVSGTETDYVIDVNVVLDNETVVKGQYTGTLEAGSRFVEATANVMEQKDINDAVPGEFYFYIHDADYSYELRMDFFTDGNSEVLPAGVYNYADTQAPFTFGPKSVLEVAHPYLHSTVTGTATVTNIDDRTVVSIKLLLNDGRTYLITFDGTPKYLNVTEPTVVNVNYNEASVTAYGNGNLGLTLTSENDDKLALDVYTTGVNYIANGTYRVSDTQGENTIVPDANMLYTYCILNGAQIPLKGGNVTVSGTGTEYVIDVNVILEDGTIVKGQYTGTLNAGSRCVETTAIAMEQKDINDAINGEFYFYIYDFDYNYELRMDFFTDGTSDVLPAGVYTFSEDKTPGTFGPKSTLDISNPSFNTTVKGTAEVSYVDGKTLVVMNLELSDGRTYIITFDGTPTYLAK